MFKKNDDSYCPPCSARNKKEYDLIRKHIKDNPGASVMEIISATGVTLKGVNCFMEDDRFHNRR